MIFYLDQSLVPFFSKEKNRFDQLMSLQGEVFRSLENRRTQKIKLGDKYFFIKQHFGVGFKEIFKNLLQLRLPIVSAKNEWLAIQRLETLSIPTQKIVAFGERGLNPATRQSFLMTEALPEHTSLEHFCAAWNDHAPSFSLKYALIQKVAQIAKTLHENGINHRDFYLCHFLLQKNEKNAIFLYLIDLHRAQIRTQTPARWIIKDLSGLYFSSKAVGLTQRDLLRFMRAYRQQPLREIFNKEFGFWQKVKKRGDQLYSEHAN